MTNRTSWLNRAGATAALLALLGGGLSEPAGAKPAPGRQRRGFDLFASSFALFNVNRVACGVSNRGAICYDPGGSPIGGGGFWPKGTPDAYIFGSGLQAAGIIASNAGFAWAGDTVGAAFYDPSIGPSHGAGLTPVYNSLVPADLAQWPNGAVVRDASLYSAAVLGQNTVSQQDLWWRQWDGDPNLLTGRKHPLGIMVETRALGWNYPAGNQDIQYLLFTFYNVSASDPARYNGLDPAIRSEIAAIGAQFASGIKSRLNVDVPPAGYKIDSLYVAFASDTDVGPAAIDNYSTAILPFNLGVAYINDFAEPAFTYPSDVFSPPFAVAPGFAGAKYLKSPIDPGTGQQVGLTMFSNTLNPNTCVSGLCDATNVVQLWRYLSGNINPAAGDNPCTVPNPKQNKVCFLAQTAADTRFFQASGPFSLDAGQSATIVVAYLFAPPVAAALAGRIGSDNPPGIPATGAQIASNPGANIRFLERAAGWVSETVAGGGADGVVSQDEVNTTPASLLAKSMVAQRLFDNRFLLPGSPTAPNFYLVPDNNKVAVIWQPSTTETLGDPYFTVASSTGSGALYDPNYRRFDVEGYRIYRGRTAGNLEMIAQFDYSTTDFQDRNGSVDYGTNCAPELARETIAEGCPVNFDTTNFTVSNSVPLTGDVVQVPRPPVAAGRVLLANGNVLLVQGDTAVSGGNSGYPSLDDTGVPFAFVDTTVRNSFTYFYAVTAFDVNSLKSGPSSLESARITKTVTPRAPAINQVAGVFTAELRGRSVLNPQASQPTINATTGVFSGPAPPSGALRNLGAQLFAEFALKQGAIASVTIDSVVPNWYHQARYFITVVDRTGTNQFVLGPDGPLGPEDGVANLGTFAPVIAADSALLASRGLENLPFAGRAQVDLRMNPVVFFSKDADWHPAVDGAFWATTTGVTNVGGSRWFTGNNETTADPTLGDSNHGSLPNVTAIYRPNRGNYADALIRRLDQLTYHVFRAADIKLYWNATTGGQLDSVIDVTHNVPILFSPQNRASWGFRRDRTTNGINATDFLFGACIDGAADVDPTGCTAGVRPYSQTPLLQNVDINGDGAAAEGPGFAMYLNGEIFIFQTAALPQNTVWTYRSYAGHVTRNAANQYSFAPAASDAPVPGLSYRFTANSPSTFPTAMADSLLERVHTVPDPYYVTSNLEATTTRKLLKFVNLPNQAIIRIYSVSGVLVSVLTHNDPAGGGEETWNLRNRNNQFIASGVYFYHLETPSGQERVGRFTVVNFAQ